MMADADFTKDKTIKELAILFKKPYNTIYKYMIRHRLPFRRNYGKSYKPLKVQLLEKYTLEQLKMKTIKEIAYEFNRTYSTVHVCLHEHNFPYKKN